MKRIEEISDIIYLLKDDKRRSILQSLIRSRNGLSFKEIESDTGIPPTGLAYHLKLMEKRGILKKEFRNMEGRRDYSFYNVKENVSRALEFSETIYERQNAKGHEQPDRLLVFPSRLGPRSFRIMY